MVSEERRAEGAEKGSGGEDGDNGRFLRRGDIEVTVWVNISRSERIFPVGHGHNTRNGTGIVPNAMLRPVSF